MVRGRAAAGGLRRPRRRVLLRVSAVAGSLGRSRADHRRAGRGSSSPLLRRRPARSSRAGASRRSARASPGRSAGWCSGWPSRSPLLRRRRRRRRGQLHHRLPHRALAVARQPVRVPRCSSRTSACRQRAPRAAAVRGDRAALDRCAAWRSSAASALIEQFHFVIYVLGVMLLVLAYGGSTRGVGEEIDPDRRGGARAAQVFPVTDDFHAGAGSCARAAAGRRRRCSSACGDRAADIAFAVDSIPAAFAITPRHSSVIWAAATRSRCSACARCSCSSRA